MATKAESYVKYYILLFMTLFNFAAVVSLILYNVHFGYFNESKVVEASNRVFKEILSEIQQQIHIRDKRDVRSKNSIIDAFPQLAEFLQSQKTSIQEECHAICRQEVTSVLRESVQYLRYKEPKTNYRRQALDNTSNELAQIFGEIANSEINIFAKYCGNNSLICLPGVKGDPGQKGEPGLQGLQGVRGPKGEKGDSGVLGSGSLQTPQPQGSACCTSLGQPEFVDDIVEVRVTEGTNVTFNCDATAYPPPSIIWSPDPNTFLKASVSTNTLLLTGVHVNDSKLYVCTARNALGAANKQFVLEVYQHLVFDRIPTNNTIMVGYPVQLECKVDGPLNPKITWYKVMIDGSLSLVTNGITVTNNVSYMHIERMSDNAQGVYICVGNNGVEKIQASAFINTYGPPHIIRPGNVTALKGDRVTLSCDANAHPPANITWTYPPGVTNAYLGNDGTLVIVNAQLSDARYFICTATNQYGSDHTQINLIVKVPPEVIVTPYIIPVIPGSTPIAIECKPSGDPPLTVLWYKDGQPAIESGNLFILPGNVLLVNSPTSSDYGAYTCQVNNTIGVAQATAYAFDSSTGTLNCSSPFTICTHTICGGDCPAGCGADRTPITVGNLTTQFTLQSSICKAAVQVGAITDSGGTVVWKNERYTGTILQYPH